MSETRIPPELARVQAFINTADLESGADGFDGPSGLKRWFVDQGLLPASATVDTDDVTAAVGLREALRAVLRANDGHAVSAGELHTLNRVLRSLPLHIQFNPDAVPEVAPSSSGVPGALTQLVAGIATSVAAGTWPRLKVCANDTCQWAFYDQSKNRSGRWCSMRVCGNRSKIRTYRRGRAAG